MVREREREREPITRCYRDKTNCGIVRAEMTSSVWFVGVVASGFGQTFQMSDGNKLYKSDRRNSSRRRDNPTSSEYTVRVDKETI
jgi:hypothetical protein